MRTSPLGAGTPPGSELFPWCFQPLWLLQSLHFLSFRGYFFSHFFNEAEGSSAKNEMGGGVRVVKPFGEESGVNEQGCEGRITAAFVSQKLLGKMYKMLA